MISRSLLFKLTSLLFLATAVYHLIGIFHPINSSPPWRHFVFVWVCLFCSYGFEKRPKHFPYSFSVLVVQQYYSHGKSLVTLLVNESRVDRASLAVLIILPILLYHLVRDSKSLGA